MSGLLPVSESYANLTRSWKLISYIQYRVMTILVIYFEVFFFFFVDPILIYSDEETPVHNFPSLLVGEYLTSSWRFSLREGNAQAASSCIFW